LEKRQLFNIHVDLYQTMRRTAANVSSPPIGNVDLRLLRVFRGVVEAGGFSAAETTLNLDRSTISLYMNRLETRLGVRLCNRGRAGFSLTQRGKVIFEATQRVLSTLEEFRAEVGAVRARLIGELTIGVVDTTVTDPASNLTVVLSKFREQASGVHVSLHVGSAPEIERAVLNHQLHLGIVPLLHLLPGLESTFYYYEQSSLYCGARHRLFDRPDESIDVMDITADYAGRGYVETAGPTEKMLDTQRQATSNEMEGIAILILSGRYVGYLPTHFAEHWERQDLIRAIRPAKFSYRSEIHVLTKKGRRQTLPVQVFLQELLASSTKRGKTETSRPRP